jgi:cytoskeletal protein CcmA (bactofilin family)
MPADDVTASFGFKAKTYDSITTGLNEIEAESDIGSYFYSFTPEKSGIYVFASDDIQPFYVTVTDDYGSTLNPYDFDHQDEFKLTRGNTYYVRVTMNGLSEAELSVSLLEEIQDYNVTVANVSHGTITVKPEVAFEGDYIEINYEPDGSYGLASLTVTDADDNEIALLDSNALQFVMPASDVTVSAAFGKTYNITVTGDKVFGAAISSELVNYDPYSVSEMAAGTEVCVLPNIHPAYSLDMFEVTTASGEIVQAELRDVSAGMGGLVPIIQPTEPEWAIVFTMPSEDVIVDVYAEEDDDVIVLEEDVPSSFTYDSSNNKAIFKFVPEESGTYNISGISSSETAYFLSIYVDGNGVPLVGDETIPGGRDINATFSVSKGSVCYAVIYSFYSTATLTVTATKTASLDDNDITVDASLGGTITAPASAVYKERVCINVAPDANFTCDDIIITGDVTGTNYDVSEYYGRYVFEMPDEAVTLSGVFTAVPVLVGHSLTLAGDIGLNFYFYYTDASEDDIVVFSFNGEETIVPIDLNDYDDETGAYKFTFNVAAADAAEDILCWYESPTAYSEDDYYSVNQYIAESGTINDDNLRNLMGSLAEYCYRANRLFKPESDFTKAEVEGYSDTIDNVDPLIILENAPEFHNFEGGVNYVGMSLVLRTKTALRIYFGLPEGKSIDDYTFMAYCPNTDTSLDLNPVRKGYLWYIEISDIASAELDNYYYIIVDGENGDPANSWNVSALSYVCQVHEREDDFSEELVNTCMALTKYNDYANIYFNA